MDNNDANITELDINFLEPNPLQPRGLITPESLEDLVSSIKQHGILEPLVIAKTPAGYQIIAGERRWRAAKQAKLLKVPVIIKKTTPRGMLEMALVENIQRTDLNPIERGQAYIKLMEEFGLSNGDIAIKIGKSPAFVSNTLRLLNLPDALKDGLISCNTTEGHVRALLSLEETRLMIDAFKIVLKEDLSVRATEELVRRLKIQNQIKSPASTKKSFFISSIEIDKMKEELAEKIEGIVKLTRSQRETKLMLVLKGSLENTENTLQKIYQAIKNI